MTESFQTVLAASDEERRDLFVGAADRLRTNEQNIEKDFWVCWTLDALFNELDAGGPRLLFKGGTSLSKGYGLIERFSEDIDITVFREDIGQPATFEELEALSGKKRNARLEAIKAACQEYIQGPMLERLSVLLRQTLQTANLKAGRPRVEADPDDPDGQSLLLCFQNLQALHGPARYSGRSAATPGPSTISSAGGSQCFTFRPSNSSLRRIERSSPTAFSVARKS